MIRSEQTGSASNGKKLMGSRVRLLERSPMLKITPENYSREQEILTRENKTAIEKKHLTCTVVHGQPKTGRNTTCPCGSGKKFKKCCGFHK